MNNTLLIQKFFKEATLSGRFDSLEKIIEALFEKYAIQAKIVDNKIILNYDQIQSPMGEEIVQECRGLILDKDTFEVICFPFRKFFNFNEGFCPKIDFSEPGVKILEKIDGSNLNLYFDKFNNDWKFSTRKVPYATNTANGGTQSFETMALVALKNLGIDFEQLKTKLNKQYTYMFELTSPYSTVYIFYQKNCLTLLAVRDIITLEEIDAEPIAKELGFPTPKTYPTNQLESLVELVNSWNGREQEGVVVVDSKFNRIKIKNRAYVLGQALSFSLIASSKNIVELILRDKKDDFCGYCKDQDLLNKIESIDSKIKQLICDIDCEYLKVEHIKDVKEFALTIQENKYKHFLFSKRRYNKNTITLLQTTNINNVLSLLGIDITNE